MDFNWNSPEEWGIHMPLLSGKYVIETQNPDPVLITMVSFTTYFHVLLPLVEFADFLFCFIKIINTTS